MKMIHLFVYVIWLLFVLTIGTSPLCAQAPTTPKILFTSGRDGDSEIYICLLYTSPSPRDRQKSRMPSSA